MTSDNDASGERQVCLDLTLEEDTPKDSASNSERDNDADDDSSSASLMLLNTTVPIRQNEDNASISARKTTDAPRRHNSEFDSDNDDVLLMGGPVFDKKRKKAVSSRAASSKATGATRKRTEKRLEKEAAKAKRLQQKQQRQAEKVLEKETKRRRLEQAQQSMGKFASKEVVVLVETTLRSSSFGKKLLEPLRETYSVQEYDGDMGGYAIQWIRKDYLDGGAKDAFTALEQKTNATTKDYQHFSRLVVVFDDPKRFLKMVHQPTDDDEYPALSSWLLKLQNAWRRQRLPCYQEEEREPRIVLLLHKVMAQVDQDFNDHRRSKSSTAPLTHEQVHDAITWLLIEFQVECILCDSQTAMSGTLQQMTRALSDMPYKQQVTELECVRKIKATEGNSDDPFERARECWLRQLQQIPRVSETKALNVAREFPTARSLWEAYQDPNTSVESKRLLLANILADDRQHVKLSDSIYQLFTSTDPKKLLT